MKTAVYARPDVYDMEYEGASNQDAHFFARMLARVRPRRLLELACGSGRVTFTLAAALPSAEIVDVDSSLDMLGNAATAHSAAEPSVRERVSLVEGDMRDWSGTGDAFDAVVIAARCRICSRSMIDVVPGPPHFACSVLAASSFSMSACPTWRRLPKRNGYDHAFVDLDIDATRWTAGEEGRLLRCTATTYEPHLQRADVRLLYDRFDQRALAERLVTDFASHVYFPAELELLFLSAGFDIAQQYGDYRFVRFDRTSPYVVTAARRPRWPGPCPHGAT
jgi:SAM-dependent methyltransferase